MIEVFDEEAVKECLNELEDSDIKYYALATLEWAINKRKVNAIKIPQNATNGDVIKAMFPKAFFDNYVNQWDEVESVVMDGEICFDISWWNAPYKVDEKE